MPPQGCVLSPLLFTLYTNDCTSTYDNRHFLKFADDTVIVSLLNNDEVGHGPVVDGFTSWCKEFYISINVSKTKDTITTHTEIVSHYKYFIDTTLSIIIGDLVQQAQLQDIYQPSNTHRAHALFMWVK